MHICFENIKKQYGSNIVLDGLDWCLEENEIWQITGPSGVGKTTLIRLLLGLEKPTEGSISGTEGIRFSAAFQENRLCEHLRAVQNLQLVCPDQTPDALVKEALKLLPEEALQIPAGELSGGMKRRVAVLRAMVSESDVVVLDEPFTGLDKDTIRIVNDYICSTRRGRTLVFVSHQETLLLRERIAVRTLALG